MAARRGLRVLLLERSAVAEGASVRNFGMIWPVGQPAGELHAIALRARELWLELQREGAVELQTCGSIHLAHRADEVAVQEEFCAAGTHEVRLLTPREVTETTSLANPRGLLAGLWSPTELRVNPRIACAAIARWLAERQGVACHFQTSVVGVDAGLVRAADGRRWQAERVVVCGGSDLATLYPQVLAQSGLRLCKLQMLKSAPQPRTGATRPAPHLASGLTLRHYAAFRDCRTIPSLQQRVRDEAPELDRYGVHVMASQLAGGEVILGDSHEYGEEISPFDKLLVDELILRESRKVFRLTDWSLSERWNGVYARHPDRPVFEAQADDGTLVFTGTGGAGMTMSFGLAERAWQRWEGKSS
jgi:FAD dependent oxidoreductase TIGR03364